MEDIRKRNREDSVEVVEELPEVKKLRYDIFDTLDDVEVDPEVSDLASVMKSFEEEISVVEGVKAVEEGELDHDLSTSEIGWLLEASDDELGLPPSGDRKEIEEQLPLPSFAAADGWGFESWEFGYGGDIGRGDGGGECLAFDDLFGYEDIGSGFGSLS